MFVSVPYTIYSWTPPELTSAEKIWLGGEIVRVGHKNFINAYTKRLTAGAGGNNNRSFTLADILDDATKRRDRKILRPPVTTFTVLGGYFC